MTLEKTVEDHLVDRVKSLGGFTLKGDIIGRRFLDRICILPDGVTLWIECKRPTGGQRTALQEHTIEKLLDLGHLAFFAKTVEEVDLVLDGPKVFHDDGELVVCPPDCYFTAYTSTPKGLKLRGKA